MLARVFLHEDGLSARSKIASAVECLAVKCPICKKGPVSVAYRHCVFSQAKAQWFVLSIRCELHGSRIKLRSLRPEFVWENVHKQGFNDFLSKVVRDAVLSHEVGALVDEGAF